MDSRVYRPKPAAGRYAVKVIEPPAEGKHGIVLVKMQQHSPTCGEIIATPSPHYIDSEEFQPLYTVGDIVLFSQYSGTEIRIGRDRVIILAEKDVLCTLELIDLSEGEAIPSASLEQIKVNPE